MGGNGRPEDKNESNISPEMIDKLIKKIASLQVELVRSKQAIAQHTKDKQKQLLLLQDLRKELETLEDKIKTKNQEIKKSQNECKSLQEKLTAREALIKEKEGLLSSVNEKSSIIETKLAELEEVVESEADLVDGEVLETTNDEEDELIEDIRKKVNVLRNL